MATRLLLVLDTPFTVNPSMYAKLPFDPGRDFAPISTVASFSLTLVVHPSVPVNSVAEFVAHAKARKDRPLIYGSGGGLGSPGHLAMEYFRIRAGFGGVHVPHKGNAEVVISLVGGQIEAGFLATPGVLQNVRDGRLKAFAVSSARRSPLAPDIPTMTESGYPGFRRRLLHDDAGARVHPGTDTRQPRTRGRRLRCILPTCRRGFARRRWSQL